VGFVNDDYSSEISILSAIEDLYEESVFAAFGGFSKLGHKDAQQSTRVDSRKMDINGTVAVLGEFLDEEPEEGRFSDTGLSDNESKGPLLGEVFEPGQGLGDAPVVEYPLYGRGFLKGMGTQFEMIEEHGCYSFL
jgi:hypothetical protein